MTNYTHCAGCAASSHDALRKEHLMRVAGGSAAQGLPKGIARPISQAGVRFSHVSGSWSPRQTVGRWSGKSYYDARQRADDSGCQLQKGDSFGAAVETACTRQSSDRHQGGPICRCKLSRFSLHSILCRSHPRLLSRLRVYEPIGTSRACPSRTSLCSGCNALQAPLVPLPKVPKFGKLFDSTSDCIAVGGRRG